MYEEKKTDPNDRFSCKNNDMTVCDTVCDVCIFNYPEDMSCCKKYPDGKPNEVLDPDYFCPLCMMTDFEF